MIEYHNKTVVMSLADLEHCGFRVDESHPEAQEEAAGKAVAVVEWMREERGSP